MTQPIHYFLTCHRCEWTFQTTDAKEANREAEKHTKAGHAAWLRGWA